MIFNVPDFDGCKFIPIIYVRKYFFKTTRQLASTAILYIVFWGIDFFGGEMEGTIFIEM